MERAIHCTADRQRWRRLRRVTQRTSVLPRVHCSPSPTPTPLVLLIITSSAHDLTMVSSKTTPEGGRFTVGNLATTISDWIMSILWQLQVTPSSERYGNHYDWSCDPSKKDNIQIRNRTVTMKSYLKWWRVESCATKANRQRQNRYRSLINKYTFDDEKSREESSWGTRWVTCASANYTSLHLSVFYQRE